MRCAGARRNGFGGLPRHDLLDAGSPSLNDPDRKVDPHAREIARKLAPIEKNGKRDLGTAANANSKR